MKNTNPILQMIIEAGLNYKAFALLYGCSLSSLRNTIYGNVDVVPATVKLSLEKAGFNVSKIDELYHTWLILKIHDELGVKKDGQV